MHLTHHTDYALRLLIALAGRTDARVQIAAVADEQAISRTHLMKIANKLARAGFIDAQRGRGGGVRLQRDPRDINIGEVVRAMEPCSALVDCSACRLRRACGLPGVLGQASAAFHAVLAHYTLADILRGTCSGPQPIRATPGHEPQPCRAVRFNRASCASASPRRPTRR